MSTGTLGRVAVVLCWLGCPGPPEPTPPTIQAPTVSAPTVRTYVGPDAAVPLDAAQFEDQRKEIMGALRTRVDQLEDAGTYSCCIKSPCSHCALMAGGCKCREGVLKGEPVCHECGMMWARGQGDVEGVEPEDVVTFLEAEKGAACACSAVTGTDGP